MSICKLRNSVIYCCVAYATVLRVLVVKGETADRFGLNLESLSSERRKPRIHHDHHGSQESSSAISPFQKYEELVHGINNDWETGRSSSLCPDVQLSVELTGDDSTMMGGNSFLNQRLPPKEEENDGKDDDTTGTKFIDYSSKLRSTGTTIAGICGLDFVVLGADTRATNGQMVADKRCDKIHELADNIYACGAGTSADLEHLTRRILFQNKLQSVVHGTIGNSSKKGMPANVQNVAQVCEMIRYSLYRQGGRCSANLVVGGVYEGRAILRAIHPHGSQDALAFTALGSGGLAAMGVLEHGYSESLTLGQAKELVTRAIRAGVTNDLGSGSQVDLCIITNEGTEKIRCHVPEDELIALNHMEEPSPNPTTTNNSVRSTPGVNGFGNHPFGLRKVRTLTVSPELQRAQQAAQWKDLFAEPSEQS